MRVFMKGIQDLTCHQLCPEQFLCFAWLKLMNLFLHRVQHLYQRLWESLYFHFFGTTRAEKVMAKGVAEASREHPMGNVERIVGVRDGFRAVERVLEEGNEEAGVLVWER